MKIKLLYLTIILLSVFFICSISYLFIYNPTDRLIKNIPGMDKNDFEFVTKNYQTVIGEFYKSISNDFIFVDGSWPRFRGINYDNINKERIKLLNDWNTKKPSIIWQVDLGEGYAAPAVLNGRVYLIDYDEILRSDVLRCFTLNDGKELWRRWYKVRIKRNHGMSRTIPAVTDKYVLTMGPKCHVMCVNSTNGDFYWGINLEKDYKSEVPMWYTGQCQLIDNDTAVIAVCGSFLMIGVDCRTGKILWNTPNRNNYKMSHSSIIPMTIHGKKMYVYCAIGGMIGVSAEPYDRGTILWETKDLDAKVIAPSPVNLNDGRIFITAGYGYGSIMFKINKNNNTFSVETLYRIRPNEGLACEQQTPVFYKGFLYGILPNDAGADRNQFICYDPEGKIIWKSGKANRFGLGPFIVADNKFFILNDNGELSVINANAKKFELMGRIKIFKGVDSWGPIAIAGSRMLLRDSTRMFCIDIGR